MKEWYTKNRTFTVFAIIIILWLGMFVYAMIGGGVCFQEAQRSETLRYEFSLFKGCVNK